MQTTHELFQTQQWGTFQALWETSVAHYGDQSFLAFQDASGDITEWSYQAFDQHVTALAQRLSKAGVTAGDSIHLCLANSPVFVALWLAASRLGAWFVPVDPGSTIRDIENQLRRVKPKVGIYATDRADTYLAAAASHPAQTLQVSEDSSELSHGIGRLEQTAQPDTTPYAVEADDRLAVMFTSGTTSEPKGVQLTQANYASVGQAMAEAAGLEPQHRWLVTLPLFHGNAQFYCFASAIATGASVGLTHRFSASGWVEQTRQLDATHASLFAAPIRMILARTPQGVQPAQLEHVWFAQSLGSSHFQDFSRLTGTMPRQLYGMTETLTVVSYDGSDNPTYDQIGKPIAGRRVQLLDPISHEPVAVGTPGVITLAGVRGRDIFDGYMDAPETNAKAFFTDADGIEWFSTGDLAVADNTGQLRFVGRVDDVVKVSGENISLTEVESALAEAPGVLEVAVVAKPDPIRDVVPIAYYVERNPETAPDTDSLETWAADNLVPAARPRQWHRMDELPRTSVGKIRRFQLTQS